MIQGASSPYFSCAKQPGYYQYGQTATPILVTVGQTGIQIPIDSEYLNESPTPPVSITGGTITFLISGVFSISACAVVTQTGGAPAPAGIVYLSYTGTETNFLLSAMSINTAANTPAGGNVFTVSACKYFAPGDTVKFLVDNNAAPMSGADFTISSLSGSRNTFVIIDQVA